MQKHEQWLRIAAQDFEVAVFLSKNRYSIQAVYHAQQAAEKALKGFLAKSNVAIIKTHDLANLVYGCTSIDDQFIILKDVAKYLSPYATLGRYPNDDYEELEFYEGEELIKHAQKLVKFVSSKQ